MSGEGNSVSSISDNYLNKSGETTYTDKQQGVRGIKSKNFLGPKEKKIVYAIAGAFAAALIVALYFKNPGFQHAVQNLASDIRHVLIAATQSKVVDGFVLVAAVVGAYFMLNAAYHKVTQKQ